MDASPATMRTIPAQSSIWADCRVVARLSNPPRGLGPGRVPRLDFRHRYRTQSGLVPRRKTMDFDYSPKQKEWMARVGAFMDQHVYPAEETYTAQMTEARAKGDPWIVVPVVEELKAKAKKQGLWNLFM